MSFDENVADFIGGREFSLSKSSLLSSEYAYLTSSETEISMTTVKIIKRCLSMVTMLTGIDNLSEMNKGNDESINEMERTTSLSSGMATREHRRRKEVRRIRHARKPE